MPWIIHMPSSNVSPMERNALFPEPPTIRVPGEWKTPPLASPLWREMLLLQSQWFIRSLIFIRVPNSGALPQNGENIQSLSTEPHVDGRPAYSWVRPGSPRGLFATLLSLPQCHAAFSTILSTLAWVDQSPVSVCSSNPLQGIHCTTVTASRLTQGRVEFEST